MSTIVNEVDVVGIAHDLLLSQDKRRAGVAGLVSALMVSFQRLETDLFDLYISRHLDHAQNAMLDRIGAWVDEPRGSLFDDNYRRFIKIKLFAISADCNVEDVLRVAVDTSAPSDVTHWTMFPAGGQIQFERVVEMTPAERARVARFIELVRPAGVALLKTESMADSFGFLEDPTALGFDAGVFAEVF